MLYFVCPDEADQISLLKDPDHLCFYENKFVQISIRFILGYTDLCRVSLPFLFTCSTTPWHWNNFLFFQPINNCWGTDNHNWRWYSKWRSYEDYSIPRNSFSTIQPNTFYIIKEINIFMLIIFCFSYIWKNFKIVIFGKKRVGVVFRAVTVFKHSYPNNREMGKKIWCGRMLPSWFDSMSANNSIYSEK